MMDLHYFPECITFPSTCKITRNEPFVQDPPVNIPYCMRYVVRFSIYSIFLIFLILQIFLYRVPCSSNQEEQAIFDMDHLKCGVRPGCYFDVELFQLRQRIAPSTLAGVPTCHHAIRKPVFRKKAFLVVQKVIYL